MANPSFDNVHWDFAQVVAWIMYRDPALSADWSERNDGGGLGSLGIASAIGAESEDGKIQFSDAIAMLTQALEAGTLVCRRTNESGTEPISAADWPSLEVKEGHSGKTELWHTIGGKISYTGQKSQGLWIASAEVLKLWPEVNIKEKGTAAKEKRAEAEVVTLLREKPDLPKAVAIEAAMRHGVSLRGAKDRVWPAARQKAGLSASASAGRKRKSAH